MLYQILFTHIFLLYDDTHLPHFSDIYRAFLVEIQPQNRVFYLNYERPYFICLQFLYGQYKGQANNRESHLIVFLHKHCEFNVLLL